MTTAADSRPKTPWPAWWFYYATLVSLIAVVSLVLGVVGVYTNGRQDAVDAAQAQASAEQNKIRDEQNRALLDCFDRFATDLSGGLPPVRKATANRDIAAGSRDDALQRFSRLLVEFVTTPPADQDEARAQFLDVVRELQSTGEALDLAQQRLQKVREANPYPPPPSSFCSTD